MMPFLFLIPLSFFLHRTETVELCVWVRVLRVCVSAGPVLLSVISDDDDACHFSNKDQYWRTDEGSCAAVRRAALFEILFGCFHSRQADVASVAKKWRCKHTNLSENSWSFSLLRCYVSNPLKCLCALVLCPRSLDMSWSLDKVQYMDDVHTQWPKAHTPLVQLHKHNM